jgi:hypothetical protein
MRLSVYSEKINSWEVLVSSLLAKLAEWPFLLPLYNELVALVADLRVVVLQQEAARAQLHEAVGRRQELERRGAELRTRLAAHLKAQLGFRNDQLRQFGLNPLPRATRRKTEEPTTEITASSDVEAEVAAD